MAPALRPGLVLRVQGWSLDFLIVAALATLSLTVIGEHFGPFILLAVVGIGWNLAAFLFLACRMIPSYWFERADAGMDRAWAALFRQAVSLPRFGRIRRCPFRHLEPFTQRR